MPVVRQRQATKIQKEGKEMTNLTDEQLVRLLAEDGMGYRYSESLTGIPHWIPPDDDISAIPCEEFDPINDANDTLMLIEALWDMRCATQVTRQKDGYLCRMIYLPDKNKAGIHKQALADTFQRAVCLAAAKAIGEEK